MGPGIFAGGFAELLARLCDIKNVINDLEGEADVVTKISECAELGRIAIGAHAAQARRTAEESGGFTLVNVSELADRNFFSFAFEISDLSGDELKRAGGTGEFENYGLM